MNAEEMNRHLSGAVKQLAPDMLDDLLTELDDIDKEKALAEEEPEVPVQKVEVKRTRRSSFTKAVLGIAAVLVMFIGGATLLNRQQDIFAVIDLDVNPGLEITINKDRRVISAAAVNKEAEELLGDMKLEGSDISVACNALIGAMLTKGYLTDEANSILVSVHAENADNSTAVEQEIAEKLNRYLEDSRIAAAILGQIVENDNELEAFAEKNGVSVGKAWLIRQLLASGSKKMTEASLLRLSTQELILLGQQKKISTAKSYGKASTSKYIGSGKAASRALKHAGVSRSEASGIMTEFDCDDGRIIYEVEFRAGSAEYEYEIDAVTGKVLSYEKEHHSGGSGSSKKPPQSASDDDDDDDLDDERDDHDDHDDHDDDHDDHDDDDD